MALDDTIDAAGPFFSPDGKWIGFSAENSLRKIPTDGGIVTTICNLSAPTRGAVWTPSGFIFYALSTPGGIYRVDADGGRGEEVTRLSDFEMFQRRPWITENDLLFVSQPPFDSGVVYRQSANEQRSLLLGDARDARVTPSRHLAFIRGEALFVVDYTDPTEPVTAPPRQVADNVVTTVAGGHFAFSNTDTLVYAERKVAEQELSFWWVSRNGDATPAGLPSGRYLSLSLSPDGRRVAFAKSGPTGQIYVHDFVQNSLSALTVADNSIAPVWTPDSKSVAYRRISPPDVRGRVLLQSADGVGVPLTLIQGHSNTDYYQPTSWTDDGRVLVLEGINGTAHALERGKQIARIAVAGSAVQDPRISPDGKWLAYVSLEGGTPRVYVQPFPALDGRWVISRDGGIAPRWSRNGRRLTFMSGTQFMEVSIDTKSGFRASEPKLLFEGSFLPSYDVSADDQRFLMMRRPQNEPLRQLTVVLHWLNEL